ncbi:GNAT family protein [Desulfatiferula olefinivorans]
MNNSITRSFSVYLRAFEREDAPIINTWRRDLEDQEAHGGLIRHVSSAVDEQWIEDIIFNTSNRFYWAICLKKNDEMIGYVGCKNIDWVHRGAVGYALYMSRAHRRMQFMLEACYLVYAYCFDQLGLNRYEVDVLESNEAVRNLHAMMGHRQEGVLRQAVFKNGRFHNVIRMALLNEEFQQVKKAWHAKQGGDS